MIGAAPTGWAEQVAAAVVSAGDDGHHGAVLVIGVDRYRDFAAAAGDAAATTAVALAGERLAGCLRASDRVVQSAADEFAVLLCEIADAADAMTAARRLLHVLSWGLPVGDEEFFLAAAIGIARFPADGGDADALLAAGRSALAAVRANGTGRVAFYEPGQTARAIHQRSVEAALRHALERDELELHYQPRVNLASGVVCGGEALLRWRRDDRLVPPAEFITLAEETGLIVPIGEWVLFETCRQQRVWLDDGLPTVPVAVNVAAQQLHAPVGESDLGEICERYLAALDVEPRWLEVELTESALMRAPDVVAAILERLRRAGIRSAIDDFGTGYSSLAYLRRLPVSVLKIDRAFVTDITADPDSAAIARAILGLAAALRLSVVAEGVETAAQMNYLRRYGCDEMQGFLYSKPVAADDFAALLVAGRRIEFADGDGAERTLLIVDDEANVLSALRRLLRRDGYRILATSDPFEALAMLAEQSVQVVLSDQRMPTMNGADFLARVKALHPDTVRLVLSGYTDLESVIRSVNRGEVWRFLTKPWDDEALREHLREAFRYHDWRTGRQPAAGSAPAATM